MGGSEVRVVKVKQPTFYHCDKCRAGVVDELIDRFIRPGSDMPKCLCGGTFKVTGTGAMDRMHYFEATLKSN